jgi:hypothetical protein
MVRWSGTGDERINHTAGAPPRRAGLAYAGPMICIFPLSEAPCDTRARWRTTNRELRTAKSHSPNTIALFFDPNPGNCTRGHELGVAAAIGNEVQVAVRIGMTC